MYLFDTQQHARGAAFSLTLVDKIRALNRRTMDLIAAKSYFYLSLFSEALPSQPTPLLTIRPKLLAALRSAVLRKDPETQASVTVLLLRNYLATSDVNLADLLDSQTQFPPTAANNTVCRYLYYTGRIRAIQLSYTAAHAALESATRKCPTSGPAVGFYQQASKLLLVVELLTGDIPSRALFRTPALEVSLQPYFSLASAVRVGDLQKYLACVASHEQQFRSDGTYTLILRLRQNVIKTGVRLLALSYSRISLRDISLLLNLPNEQTTEYITAKAIRDNVLPPSTSLDHEHGVLVTAPGRDAYATTEPSEAFHVRIEALLEVRDECVRAMRYPMGARGSAREEALKVRERERELERGVWEGEDDGDEDEGGFEGM